MLSVTTSVGATAVARNNRQTDKFLKEKMMCVEGGESLLYRDFAALIQLTQLCQ